MKPNIIFYFTDQQRADTCGCYGQKLNITPNLDELASEGIKFEWAFTPQPVCGPCRAIFQTGKYPTETGCFKNNISLPNNIKTLANYIEDLGYQTAYIGKWHLASGGNLKNSKNADFTNIAVPIEFRGGYTGFWRASDVLEFTSHGYNGYVFDENNNKINYEGYRADCITDLALDFFEIRDKNKPFFMTISHIEPHHQNDTGHYEGPIGSKSKYKNCEIPSDLMDFEGDYLNEYPDYLGACESLDQNLGKLIKKLKSKNVYDNTIIIFSSDHGSHFKTRNKDINLNGGDDYKRSCHDSCLRVPLVIKGGKFIGGKTINEIVSTASLPKTILYMAGLNIENDMIGENLADIINKKESNRINESFSQISESRVGRCIRTDKYTYSVCAPNLNGFEKADSDIYIDDFLYDNEKDPDQLNNLVSSSEYFEVKKELRKRLLNWIQKEENKTPTILD